MAEYPDCQALAPGTPQDTHKAQMASQDNDKLHTAGPLDSAADNNCMVVQSVARMEKLPGVTASFRGAGFAQTVLMNAG